MITGAKLVTIDSIARTHQRFFNVMENMTDHPTQSTVDELKSLFPEQCQDCPRLSRDISRLEKDTTKELSEATPALAAVATAVGNLATELSCDGPRNTGDRVYTAYITCGLDRYLNYDPIIRS